MIDENNPVYLAAAARHQAYVDDFRESMERSLKESAEQRAAYEKAAAKHLESFRQQQKEHAEKRKEEERKAKEAAEKEAEEKQKRKLLANPWDQPAGGRETANAVKETAPSRKPESTPAADEDDDFEDQDFISG